MPLFLTSKHTALHKMRFIVPHREKPWTARKLEERFPHLKDALDGKSPDAFLCFFYKYNKVENAYEFIDADAEDDFADLLGVKVLCVSVEDAAPLSAPLTHEQILHHKENMSMIREGLDFLKESTPSTEKTNGHSQKHA